VYSDRIREARMEIRARINQRVFADIRRSFARNRTKRIRRVGHSMDVHVTKKAAQRAYNSETEVLFKERPALSGKTQYGRTVPQTQSVRCLAR
jgi:hypothetical protein